MSYYYVDLMIVGVRETAIRESPNELNCVTFGRKVNVTAWTYTLNKKKVLEMVICSQI